MLQKIALAAASMTAALVLAGGLALAGFGWPAPAADMQTIDQVVPADATLAAPQEPQVQVDTVYLTPQATPKDITVTKVQVATVSSGHGGDDSGEAGDD